MTTRSYEWQEECVEQWRTSSSPDFAVFATMGAGKTRTALQIAKRAQSDRDIRRIIVVVHSRFLVGKWARDAMALGLELLEWDNRHGSALPPDVAGIVVTYGAVSSIPPLYRKLSATTPTLVIFDE